MRSISLYLVLVGAPLLGLLLILRAGERLVPPRSIGGTWELDDRSVEQLGTACPSFEFRERPAVLVVAQSGTRAEVKLADRRRTSLAVTLDGDSLAGALDLAPGRGCAAGPVAFRARVAGAAGAERMTGTLGAVDCAQCPAAGFVAVRRPTSPGS